MKHAFPLVALLGILVGCQGVAQQARAVCDSYGWNSQRCAYAQQQAAAQQSYSRSLMQQGLMGLGGGSGHQQPQQSVICTPMGMHTVCQ